MEMYTYQAPTLTVDIVIFSVHEDGLKVLLVKRADYPFKGELALPGAYVAAGSTMIEALEERVLKRKVGIRKDDLTVVEQLYAFDSVGRDPRGHAVSVTYMGLGNALVPEPSKLTQNPVFLPVQDIQNLAFDHENIVIFARERLQELLVSTTAVYALLPKKFTLTQLQLTYEAVLGHPLDKRNFRKKFLSLDLLEATEEYFHDGAHRPALLYYFKQRKLQPLDRSFE